MGPFKVRSVLQNLKEPFIVWRRTVAVGRTRPTGHHRPGGSDQGGRSSYALPMGSAPSSELRGVLLSDLLKDRRMHQIKTESSIFGADRPKVRSHPLTR